MDITIFKNSEFGEVRTFEDNGKVLFCALDIAKALGYANPAKAVIDHCKGVTVLETPTNGGTQSVKYITEGSVYRLITHSKLPSAEKFESWVFDEVLPTIRRHGMYAKDELLNNPDLMIAALTELKAEREKAKQLAETVAVQNQQIVEMKPKASYYDVVLNCSDLVAISVIAKDYGWSANRMNQYLHNKGVQYKQGNIWLLYQQYAELGYTSTKTHSYPGNDGTMHTKVHTYWTQSGRLFIYDLLKADGILPLIEQSAA